MTGAQCIAQALKDAGVEVAFVFPGGTISRLLEAMDDAGIRVVVAVNEAGAGHAAQGYWRVTGKVPVVAVTSGPGVTNALTPMADAFFDRDSVVYLCGQASTDQTGRGTAGSGEAGFGQAGHGEAWHGEAWSVRQRGFQWVDTVALTQPISVWSQEASGELAQSVMDAYRASVSRRGPSVLSLPADLLK